ncbi:contractile injection system tape measure protein [uncultured Bacteroides sp.]|uniref:contractile injection system tape measure protein n=1 Tax=uncultured Bacteroides sp. TaxID=162156 RepID=UPI002591B687|nr:contractile injection system tape measure protein [uncultured Bacteroides sp.]
MKNEKIDMSRETDTFRVSQEGMYIITGTNSRHGITVSAGVRATIVLQDANLCDLENMGVAFHIAEDCHITVILEGNNMLHSGREMAAIQLRKNSILIIKGDGKLIAYGGEGAAGIGCGYATECGDIIIESGTIEAYAGYQYETSWRAGSAGIGGAGQYAGRKSKCGNITITGGKIMAKCDKGNWDIGPGDEGTCGSVKVDKNAIAPGVRVYGSHLGTEQYRDLKHIPISNAGLVILFPFLPMLFMRLNMLSQDRRGFNSNESKVRAIFILQHLMASEDREYDEKDLFLNRLLINYPFNEPLPKRMELNQDELNTIDSLLEAAKTNWEKMRNTSMRGFQEAFLRRAGFIEKTEREWVLTVEERAFDILLDSIPWSYKLVRLPWMENILKVNWR